MKASMTMKLGSAILTLLPFVACDCGDDLGNLAPAGVIEPVHFDFGPVTMGTECQAELNVINTGQSDYSVEKAEVIDSNGDFSILITPKEVALGRSEKLLVRYIAGSVAGTRESGTVQLTTTILLITAAFPPSRASSKASPHWQISAVPPVTTRQSKNRALNSILAR